MDSNDLLVRWSTLSLEEIEAQLMAGTDKEAAEHLFGADEVTEMRALMEQPQARGLREAVVLLPGMMGSLLSSIRGVTTLLWINPAIFLKGQSSYLELNQDGTGDAHPHVDSAPVSIEKLVYLKITIALRCQTDLYEFPYDWRRPIEWNGDLLHRCIERWADGDPDQQFTLVGHSMGGLVARAYLARHTQAAEQRVKGLIMHGTPHFGAAAAVENMVEGNQVMAIVARLNRRNTPRRLVLNWPSIYQLLPAPPDLFPPHRSYPANWDLYDAGAWRLEGIRQDYLDAGRRFHELLASVDPQVEIVQVAGCNLDTVVEVERSSGPNEVHQFKTIRQNRGPDAGDGTVPLWSAALPSATVYYIQQEHQGLPANRKVIEATLNLIQGEIPDLPTDLPPPEIGLLARAAPASADVKAERLREHLEEGTANAKDLSLLYFAL